MSLWRQIARGLRALVQRRAADQDIADEVDHYLEEAAAAWQASGLSPDEARRAARLELGGARRVREQVRTARWEHALETLAADVRYGARRLGRTPGFTAVGALTLALGIGASTTIFSILNPVLLRPLPYPDADRLMMIWDAQNGGRLDVTFGTYREIRQRSHALESMAVMRPLQATLTGVDEPERLDGQFVSADYFRVLGVRPAIGRDLDDSDDQVNRPFVALISDALWRRRFGADPAVVGRPILLDDVGVTVIGVLPPEFENVLSPSAGIWMPLQYDAALPFEGREWGHHLRLVGRVRAGVRLDDVREDLAAIARTPRAEFPRPAWASLEHGFIAGPLQDDLTRGVRPVLRAVLGAVILLLVIACVNVTNLLLARGAGRRAELAMRAALGASRGRLTRQLLVETLLLVAAGGALGAAGAHVAVDAVMTILPAELPRAGAIRVDRAALALTAALTMSVGLIIGLGPALLGAHADIHGGLQQRTARLAGGRRFIRRALVVAQISLALVLVVCTGLLLRSLHSLMATPPGFEAAQVLTMQVHTAGSRFREPAAVHRFFADVLAAVRQAPGVAAAALTSQLPLTGDEDVWGVHFESVPAAAGGGDVYRYAVGPGYLEAMGIPLLAGRPVGGDDVVGAPLTVAISDSFARRRFPGLDPIGQRLRIGPDDGPWFTIVGVVGDVTQTSLAARRADAVYVSAEQWHFADRVRWLVVRAQGDAAALTPAVRSAIQAVDRNQPVVRVATMDERLRASVADRRFVLFLFQAFGGVALVLAAIGVYSLLSGGVTERTREMGVRAALGATRRGLLALVLRQGMTLVALGITLGLAGALMASRALITLLFGVSWLDAATYVGAAALLTGVSLVACAIPAWRAAQTPPSVALRSE